MHRSPTKFAERTRHPQNFVWERVENAPLPHEVRLVRGREGVSE